MEATMYLTAAPILGEVYQEKAIDWRRRLAPDNEEGVAFWNTQLTAIPATQNLRIGEFIAGGRDGNVFQLIDVNIGKVSHVLKVACGRLDADSGAHLVANIRHPGICSPIHFFHLNREQNALSLAPSEGPEYVAVIMPYIEGAHLKSKMADLAERTEKAFRFGLLLTQALYKLSQHGIEHYDLHDENILVTQELEPVIIDFDRCRKIATVSCGDYLKVQMHLRYLGDLMNFDSGRAKRRGTFKPSVISFFPEYLTRHCNPRTAYPYDPSPELPQLPLRMIALLKGCIDYHDANAQSDKPFDQESLERSIQTHEAALRPSTHMVVLHTCRYPLFP